MELYPIGASASHFGDLLTGPDRLPFLYQQPVVVGVCGEETLGMLDDDETAIADKSAAGIDDPPVLRGHDRLPAPSPDIDPIVAALAETADDLPFVGQTHPLTGTDEGVDEGVESTGGLLSAAAFGARARTPRSGGGPRSARRWPG